MSALLGVLVLLLAGLVLRRALRMDSRAQERRACKQLSPERHAIYAPIAMEVETQVAILAISLNDAIEERNSGHHEIAWRLVRLAASEWERVAEIIAGLGAALQKNVGYACVPVSYRGIVAQRFKSQTTIDHVRMQELLIQLVFRSRMRFHLQVDALRRVAARLSAEFYRTYHAGERIEDRSPEVWERLDVYLYDFDLLSKEALLALRACLMGLPDSALKAFSADLEPLLRRGVRTASVPADE